MDRERALAAALDSIEASRDEVVATLSALIQVPSVNPNYPHFEGVPHGDGTGESAANEVLRPVYDAAGCEVATVEVVEGRANLVGVRRGAGGGPLADPQRPRRHRRTGRPRELDIGRSVRRPGRGWPRHGAGRIRHEVRAGGGGVGRPGARARRSPPTRRPASRERRRRGADGAPGGHDGHDRGRLSGRRGDRGGAERVRGLADPGAGLRRRHGVHARDRGPCGPQLCPRQPHLARRIGRAPRGERDREGLLHRERAQAARGALARASAAIRCSRRATSRSAPTRSTARSTARCSRGRSRTRA